MKPLPKIIAVSTASNIRVKLYSGLRQYCKIDRSDGDREARGR